MRKSLHPAIIRCVVAAAPVTVGLFASVMYASPVSTATYTGAAGGGLWSNAGNWGTSGDGVGATAGDMIPGTDQNVDIVDGTSSVQFLNNTNGNGGFTSNYTTSGALIIAQGNTLHEDHNGPTLVLDGGLNSNATTGGQVSGFVADTGLYNAGTINAGTSGATLTLTLGGGASQSGNYSTNVGVIEATAGGKIDLDQSQLAGGINNNTGTIEALGTSTLHSVLQVNAGAAPRINGGTVSSDQNSTITSSGSNTSWILSGVTFINNGTYTGVETNIGGGSYSYLGAQNGTSFSNAGSATFEFNGSNATAMAGLVIGSSTLDSSHFKVSASTTPDSSTFTNSSNVYFLNEPTSLSGSTGAITEFDLNTSGAIANNGKIYFTTTTSGETGGSTWIRLGSSAAITGTGSMIFNDSASNYVGTMNGASGNPTLTLGSGQTLSGAVHLGNGQVGITNNGIIYANGVNPIIIATAGGNTFTNNGTLQIKAGSTISDTDSSLKFSSGSSFVVTINSSNDTSGLLDLSGSLDLSSSPTLTITDASPSSFTPGMVFTLIVPSSITGAFAGYGEGSTYNLNGESFTVSYQGRSDGDAGGNMTLTSAGAVPEPASIALLGLGALGLLCRRRKWN